MYPKGKKLGYLDHLLTDWHINYMSRKLLIQATNWTLLFPNIDICLSRDQGIRKETWISQPFVDGLTYKLYEQGATDPGYELDPVVFKYWYLFVPQPRCYHQFASDKHISCARLSAVTCVTWCLIAKYLCHPCFPFTAAIITPDTR